MIGLGKTAPPSGVMPVGSIYLSLTTDNPTNLFGGTWERIKDTFLLAAGDTYALGETGGASTVTLSTANMPAHTHTRGTMNITGALTERPCSSSAELFRACYDGCAAEGGAFYTTLAGDALQWSVTVQTSGTSNHKNNLHQFDASRSWTGATSSVGSGTAHDNMPPYLAVYIWKRIS